MPPRKGEARSWSREMDEFLTDMVGRNISLSRCAVAINEKFGTRLSRNAAIGRSHRLGIGKGGPRKAPVRVKSTVPRTRVRKSPTPRPIIETERQEKPRCVEVAPLALGLMELNDCVCRFPYGNGPFTFCGNPVRAKSVYCAPHHAFCHDYTPAPRRPDAGRTGRKASIRSFNDFEVV